MSELLGFEIAAWLVVFGAICWLSYLIWVLFQRFADLQPEIGEDDWDIDFDYEHAYRGPRFDMFGVPID